MIAATLCFGALVVFWCEEPKQTVTRDWCKTEKQIMLQIRKAGRKPISRNSRAGDKRNYLIRQRVYEQRCNKQPSR